MGTTDTIVAAVRQSPTPGSVDTSSPQAWPPVGFVDRHGAARMFGVAAGTWGQWERRGRVADCGRIVPIPGTGTRTKLYAVEELQQLLDEFAKVPAFPPAGFVDRHEAARMFGVSGRTWSVWEVERGITCGKTVAVPGRAGRQKIYPVEELRRLVEAFNREAEESSRRLEPYPDPDRPGVVRVPVASTKHEGMEALVDVDDLPTVRGKRWNFSPGSGGRGMNSGAVVWSGRNTPLARMLMDVVDDPQQLVSHVNGDKLDCRRANLVVRTRSESRRAARRPAKWDRVGEPYPDPDRPGVVRVPVCSDKHEGMEAVIDAGDLPLVQGKRWNWSAGKPDKGDGRGSVVLRTNGTPKPSLSRIILGIEDPRRLVSHLNGDRLDCRRENLVLRNAAEVKAAAAKVTSKGGRPCSSRYKGLHWNDVGRKWSATITAAGTTRQLGRFLSEIDAALAYDAAARELYGQHARLNFPDPAEAERLRTMQPPVEPGTFPPPGMVDADDASRMFSIPLTTWTAWERMGRQPACGQAHPTPDGGHCVLYGVEDLNRVREQIRALAKPYPDPDRPGVYRVPLMSYVCYREAIIDAASLPAVEGQTWHWQGHSDGSGGGQVALTSVGREYTPLARVVAGVTSGGRDARVQHRNDDPLDCRTSNIIVRTMQEQMFANRKMGTVNGRRYTSKFKGVSWSKKGEKWLAVIQKDGRSRRLGSFRDEIAAAEAYDEAARELFGEHARLNFPDGVEARLLGEAQDAAAESETREAA
jgi:hypothetical protein